MRLALNIYELCHDVLLAVSAVIIISFITHNQTSLVGQYNLNESFENVIKNLYFHDIVLMDAKQHCCYVHIFIVLHNV